MKSLYKFVDLEFLRGRGDQVEKSWKFQGVGGSNVKPSEMENLGGGGGSNWKKTSVGRVWIFSGTTHSESTDETNCYQTDENNDNIKEPKALSVSAKCHLNCTKT